MTYNKCMNFIHAWSLFFSSLNFVPNLQVYMVYDRALRLSIIMHARQLLNFAYHTSMLNYRITTVI